MEGLLLVDKPAGWTSFDVVKYVRGVVAKAENLPSKKVKVGHSGTLDPFATGLLIILIGKSFTTKAESLLKMDKTYFVKMELGKISSSGDPEGELSLSNPGNIRPDQEQLDSVFKTLSGKTISQVPPAFSAIKVNGVRAYKLARNKVEVKLEPRNVTIYSLKLLKYEFPLLEFEAVVSSGTYIRSLVEDIGKDLGTGAYTTSLRRTSIGSYSISAAVQIANLNEQTISSMLRSQS